MAELSENIVGDHQNLFTLGRVWQSEDQLTEMIAWLISVVPAVGAQLVSLVFPDSDPSAGPCPETQKVIQGGRLDLLLETPDARVVVESKLGSAYAPDQLRRYLRWLADESPAKRSALLTLTQHPGEWTPQDVALADRLGISHAAIRWEEIHALLDGAADPADNPIAARLVQEFRDLLHEEGLIPVKPLSSEDLSLAWPDAYAVISHFHDFFASTIKQISAALGGTPTAGRSSSIWWTYQTFNRPGGGRPTVGISCKYENGVPFVWITVAPSTLTGCLADASILGQQAPEGWRVEARPGWYGQPMIWRDLSDVISTGTLEDQQRALAESAAVALIGWLGNVT